eukprot:COSAG02_NODE_535_length_20660_cov_37.561111_5_plen_78_part_00
MLGWHFDYILVQNVQLYSRNENLCRCRGGATMAMDILLLLLLGMRELRLAGAGGWFERKIMVSDGSDYDYGTENRRS